MKDSFRETLKEWHPDNWETIYTEVEDSKRLLQRDQNALSRLAQASCSRYWL